MLDLQTPPPSATRVASTAPEASRRRACARDRWFALEMAAHRSDVYACALRLTRDRDLAEDVTQEALLRAWRFRHTLDDRRRFKQWVLMIARREFARLFERVQPATVMLHELPEDDHPRSFDGSPVELEQIQSAILELKPASRDVIVMKAVFGYSVAEIAERIGVASALVSVRLFRAREALRAPLADACT